ncbi:beta-ketoacyl-[acyl-carrier-protein] synthase family protein [Streptomyces cavernae]|uniref:beta-ketoacyl-[acyl-carrier-protein] synthase family protein n=1 Tax=Streptomyces cavernae TaxID=2259034 RepID=UPI000FEBAFDD|nr:beta-ketoacyl-[acyl-carrier-protein] synthase family protein [Streptomyces cavernae]
MTEHDIAVTGIGLVTPAGIGTQATWRGLLEGASTATVDPELTKLDVDFTCRVAAFAPEELLGRTFDWRPDRAAQFALVAAREAVIDAGLRSGGWDPTRVGVVLGVGGNSLDRYPREYARINAGRAHKMPPLALARSVPNMVSAEVALDLGARGPSLSVTTACASGATALGVARDLLRGGSCDVVVTGGAESGCSYASVACYQQTGTLSEHLDDPEGACRPFDRDRDGAVLGEGAGILVLERTAHAVGRGARPRALLAGFGATSDAHDLSDPHPEGRGAAEAMTIALRDAGLGPADVGHVNAHGVSTVPGDLAEYRALHTVFGTPPPVTANKSVLGHALGAASGIEAAVTVLTLQQQVIPPTANLDSLDPAIELDVVRKSPRHATIRAALSNSFGFGGQNAAAVFTSAT